MGQASAQSQQRAQCAGRAAAAPATRLTAMAAIVRRSAGGSFGWIRAEGIKPVSTTPIPAAWLPLLLRLPDPIFEALLGRTMKLDPEARSSMWEDLKHGRRTAIDYLQGVTTEIGRARGRQAPLSRRFG